MNKPEKSIFVHVLTWNSKPETAACLEAVLRQEGLDSLKLLVSDNNSSNGIAGRLAEQFAGRAQIVKHPINLGFCAAHNWAAALFLESKFEFFLVLNPDVRLKEDAVRRLCGAMEETGAGSACPRLYRADSALNPVEPRRIDSTGMILTKALRHLDRGSEEADSPLWADDSFVFGGSGAALLMTRAYVQGVILDAGVHEDDKLLVYPALREGSERRVQLFDEAFFAYREDADLAWRAFILGWKCVYVGSAIGFHERVVLPERRKHLPPSLNAMSVRNRFLLQLNNYFLRDAPGAFLPGIVWRNLLVLLGVLFLERSSIKALREVIILARRALARRKSLKRRRRTSERLQLQ